MKLEDAWKLMEQGKKIRRPSWVAGRYMVFNQDGIEATYDAQGNLLALGYRVFDMATEPEDFEEYVT